MTLTFLLDELWLGFVNYLSWQQLLWLQTAWYEPEPDPPDGGTPWPLNKLRDFWRGLFFIKIVV